MYVSMCARAVCASLVPRAGFALNIKINIQSGVAIHARCPGEGWRAADDLGRVQQTLRANGGIRTRFHATQIALQAADRARRRHRGWCRRRYRKDTAGRGAIPRVRRLSLRTCPRSRDGIRNAACGNEGEPPSVPNGCSADQAATATDNLLTALVRRQQSKRLDLSSIASPAGPGGPSVYLPSRQPLTVRHGQ